MQDRIALQQILIILEADLKDIMNHALRRDDDRPLLHLVRLRLAVLAMIFAVSFRNCAFPGLLY
jgi:hypothetical protein